jgi:homoserine O-succinyltransferase
MTVILPRDRNTQKVFEARGVAGITHEQAVREDIRALRVGILNLSRPTEEYEATILNPLGRSVMQIDPVWIRLKTRKYADDSRERINRLYVPFEDAIGAGGPDGLLVVGSDSRDGAFTNCEECPEISRILRYARKNIAGTMGIGAGALALSSHLGLTAVSLKKALFGICRSHILREGSRLTSVLDDEFVVPCGLYKSIPDEAFELESERGTVNLLAHAEEVGYLIAETTDHRFLMHFGRPEFEPQDFQDELALFQTTGEDNGIRSNENGIVNRWRGHCTSLFSHWIKHIHEATSY